MSLQVSTQYISYFLDTRCTRAKEQARPGEFEPLCNDADGLFVAKQCFRAGSGQMECWCVNIHDGEEIQGTRRPKKDIDCGEAMNLINVLLSSSK